MVNQYQTAAEAFVALRLMTPHSVVIRCDDEVLNWLEASGGGHYSGWPHLGKMWFEREEDAVMVKVAFGAG